MRKLFIISVLISIAISGYGQLNSDGYKTTIIKKKVSDFELKIDLSTPLNSYLSREYIMVSGKESLWHSISTYEFAGVFNPRAADAKVPQEKKDAILNSTIEELVVYNNSAAAVITYNENRSLYYISGSRLEDGKWVNCGQDMGNTLEEARQKLPRMLTHSYNKLPVISRLKQMPKDIQPFTDYIKKNGQTPKDFVLSALSEHKIVIYGEYHRRKVSWDLLKKVIQDPQFTKTTGTVFMELPSRMQPTMNLFLEKDEMDTELLLQIFREEQPHGWWDKGEFEFLTELWKANKSQQPTQKMQVVLVDFQIPYSDIKNKEEYETCFQMNRNLHMANVIEAHVNASADKRNYLFIVGCGHAYKSHVPGEASTPRGQKVELTAGAQLVERFSDQEVFTIFQHVMPTNNSGRGAKFIRGGAFDRAFEEAGNTPVAFKLKGSPFGAEPFDGCTIEFNPLAGSYEKNFDGYIFLQPLKEEIHSYVLYEIFTDAFAEEIKRRAAYMGIADDRAYWFATKTKDLTAKRIKEVLWNYSENKKRYPESMFK